MQPTVQFASNPGCGGGGRKRPRGADSRAGRLRCPFHAGVRPSWKRSPPGRKPGNLRLWLECPKDTDGGALSAAHRAHISRACRARQVGAIPAVPHRYSPFFASAVKVGMALIRASASPDHSRIPHRWPGRRPVNSEGATGIPVSPGKAGVRGQVALKSPLDKGCGRGEAQFASNPGCGGGGWKCPRGADFRAGRLRCPFHAGVRPSWKRSPPGRKPGNVRLWLECPKDTDGGAAHELAAMERRLSFPVSALRAGRGVSVQEDCSARPPARG